jgi:hypothetical protein
MIAEFTFGQELMLDLVGPIATALVGTLAVGVFVRWATDRSQDRRAAKTLRHELISMMSQAAGRVYMQTRHFERVKKAGHGVDKAREELDHQYLDTRVDGTVLEQRLRAYFDDEDPRDDDVTRPAVLWHATLDLLAVRYFVLTDQSTDTLLRDNEKTQGRFHSGLSFDELKDGERVNREYEVRRDTAMKSVLTHKIERPGSGPNAARS